MFFLFLLIVFLLPVSEDVELRNAAQSPRESNSYLAAAGIDGNPATYSMTDRDRGVHWWRASMDLVIVHELSLKAYSEDHGIKVSLYKNGSTVGECGVHPGDGKFFNMGCDKVPADKVMLILKDSQMTVYELTVKGIMVPLGNSLLII